MYVVVIDNDKGSDPDGSLVMETYIKYTDLPRAIRRKESIEAHGNYGKARIAKLEFINEKETENE